MTANFVTAVLLSVLVGCDARYSVQSSMTVDIYIWNYSCSWRVAMHCIHAFGAVRGCLSHWCTYVCGYTCCILVEYLPSQCFLQWYCFWWSHWYSVLGNPADFSIFWQFSGYVIVEVICSQLAIVHGSIFFNVPHHTFGTKYICTWMPLLQLLLHYVQLFSTTSAEVMVFIDPSNASWHCFLCVVIYSLYSFVLWCAGFPPTFGPTFVNVYGSQREFSVLPSKYKLMDKGKVSDSWFAHIRKQYCYY